ncbi:MAG: class I poly(R)-hydroxyalkanoic acid synthase [Betaproteobacteria bacterium]|nr:MAG: class I poly(R)-hydroxyalkanoic acid synthase [Betaproteobacteria bacterium]
MAAQQISPEDLVGAIAAAGDQVAQGWMKLAAQWPQGAPAAWLPPAADTGRVQALQKSFLEQQTRLWTSMLAGNDAVVAKPEPGDRRFAAQAWRENSYFNYLKQSYLLTSQYMNAIADAASLDAGAKARLRFAVKQWTDAMCPANFAATNPEALRQAIESQGESITRGLANLLADARRGRISQSDESAFGVGRNLAVTPGTVVYENDLMQLIQYAPATRQVGVRPLVMVPPCINKYYILDLQPENSFARYALEQGHTVFMVSWRNVGPEQGHYGWDDYLQLGILEPFRIARRITRADRVNALGFCVGGTLLGAALAVQAAKGEDSVASVTFLTTMLDFSEPGTLGVFVDEASVRAREAAIGAGGILPGRELDSVFSALRANDLIWPYVVNNYLLGSAPAAFDLLYWNADGTNLPGPMYCYYLRHTYLENKLSAPAALANCGVPVDLGRVRQPAFVYSSREDHIVPWRAAYRTLALLGGEKHFVLGASGHIAGVINPPSKNRRSFWVGEPYPAEPQAWLEAAREQPGSWWPRWAQWLERFKGGTRRAPRQPGSAAYRAIEPAPGRYVKQRAQ